VVSYAIRGDYLDFSATHTDFSSNPDDFLFNVFVARPSRDADEARTAKLDIEKEFDAGSPLTLLRFGLRGSSRTKDTVASQWRLNRAGGVAIGTPPSLGTVFGHVDFAVDGAGSAVPARLLVVDAARIPAVFFPGGKPVAGTVRADLLAFGAQSTYTIEEDTRNAYVSGSWELGAAGIETGLRYVRTEQVSSGFKVENANLATQRITPVSYRSTYAMWLPSASVRYELSPKLLLRGAASRTLTRPDLNQLAPAETVNGIDQGGGRGTRGNPGLKPYKSNNLDLGVEWYADKAAMLGMTLFRKDIGGYIDTTTFVETRSFPRQADGVIVTGPITFTQPVNGVSAKVDGAELTVQSRLAFLPAGWWRKLGGIFNYTYTRSTANFAVAGDVRSSGLPGLSKNSYNASVYYDDGRFDGRLSYAWRGRYLAQFSDDFGVPRFRNPYGQFDLTASYRISKRLTFQVDVLNLTAEQFVDKSSARLYPFGVYDLDRRVLVGLRYAN
jgi:TonB-dependent receptor